MDIMDYRLTQTLTVATRRPARLSLCIPALAPAAVAQAVADGAIVVDGRPPEAYDECHIPGSVSVPLAGGAFESRARSVIERGARAVAVADDDADARAMARSLMRIGARGMAGILDGGLGAYRDAGYGLARQPAAPADRLFEDLQLGGAVLVDARDDEDWARGHVPGSVHLPLWSLARLKTHLPRTPLVVACGDGRRAATAASVLRRRGRGDVWRIAGAGLPYLLSHRLDLRGA
jgi:rhodanese-related sulfurtransferase